MRSPRTMPLVVLASLALALVPLPPAATAATQAAIPSDFNGDGYADLAIGVPGENQDCTEPSTSSRLCNGPHCSRRPVLDAGQPGRQRRQRK